MMTVKEMRTVKEMVIVIGIKDEMLSMLEKYTPDY